MGEVRPYLEELLVLSQEQERVLMRENIEMFQCLGDNRDTIISKMKGLNVKPEQLDDEERELLRQINALDVKNSEELSRQFEKVKAELKNFNVNTRRDKKYMEQYSGIGVGSYFDTHEGR